jgi:hypothetical protein
VAVEISVLNIHVVTQQLLAMSTFQYSKQTSGVTQRPPSTHFHNAPSQGELEERHTQIVRGLKLREIFYIPPGTHFMIHGFNSMDHSLS